MKSIAKLGLGTVQWGLSYGIANRSGVTAPEMVTALLAEARCYGIEVLDTASQYGNSEAVLGGNSLEGFKIITKTPTFASARISDVEAELLQKTFRRSLELLGCRQVHGLLVHHADDLLVPGGERLVTALKELQEEGALAKIGVSVYEAAQIDAVLKVFTPDLVQLPLNVLDQRLLASGHLALLKEKGVEIHVRSVFLQGLLLMPLNDLPAYFEPIRPLLGRLHEAALSQGVTVSQASLAFVKNLIAVDTVLVGFDNVVQFHSGIEDFGMDTRFDATGLACNDPRFVNPSRWKLQ